MKSKKVWRYYCDFYKKSGCSKYHLANHEKHCTMNPLRECRMCMALGMRQRPMEDLIAVLLSDGIDGLKEGADGCPACTLAAFKQGKEEYYKDCDDPQAKDIPFTVVIEYDEMKTAFWNRVNDKNWESGNIL